MEESVFSPILEDNAHSQEDDIILWPVAGLLSRQLTELREHNRELLATLNAEKDVNEHLLMQYQEEMQLQGKTPEEIEKLLADQSKFKLANPIEFEVSPEIQELGKLKKRKRPLPDTIEERLEKKIKGVKTYQNQLERNIKEAKQQNFKARSEILKQRRVHGKFIFHNGMTYERWRREFIPYSDSDSE